MSKFEMKRRDGGDASVSGSTEKSRRAVLGYVIALAAAVVILILLSYFIHQRDSQLLDTLHKESASAQQSVVVLQTENQKLVEENNALKAQLGSAASDNESLSAQLDDAQDALDETKTKYEKELKKLREELENLKKQQTEPNNE